MPRISRVLQWYSALTTFLLFLVLIAGFVVTDTGSGRGCGGSWPLCNGRFVPAFALHTAIEFSHRVLSGVAGLMVLVLAVWAWRAAGRLRSDLGLLGAVGLLGVLAQAILGAANVLFPESATVLAFHFGVSLIAFAGVALTTVRIWQRAPAASLGRAAVPRDLGNFPAWVWATLAYTYVVVYVGAYLAHRGTGLACPSWPWCGAPLSPFVPGATLLPMAHRLLGLVVFAAVILLMVRSRPLRQARPDLHRACHAAVVLAFLQVWSGAYLVWSRLSLGASLLHIALMVLLFTVESYLALQVTAPVPAGERFADTPAHLLPRA
jgi:cytochrome c oxidase assembly protein subunit 15